MLIFGVSLRGCRFRVVVGLERCQIREVSLYNDCHSGTIYKLKWTNSLNTTSSLFTRYKGCTRHANEG